MMKSSTGCMGRVLQALHNLRSLACVDSGATGDMCPLREAFQDYVPLKSGYVTVANNARVPCLGRGTICLRLGGKTVRLRNALHIPDLDMTLISSRVHRRRGAGCSFVADGTGCFLTFPTFFLEIDDSLDCVVACSACHDENTFDYDECKRSRVGYERLNPS